MATGCGDVLSLEDLQIAKKHQLFEAEVITGLQGGVTGGASIDYATNQVTGQVQKTLPAVLRDAGFRPASFTFATGGTIPVGSADLAVLWPVSSGGDGNYYAWKGALPKVIPASSTPAGTGGVSSSGWVPFGDITLRSQLISSTSGYLVDDAVVKMQLPFTGSIPQSLHDFSKVFVNVISFGADPSGVIDSTSAIQAAIDAVYARGGGEVYIPATSGDGTGNNAGYKVSSSIMLKPFVNLRGDGFSSMLKATTAIPNGVITLMASGGISGRYIKDLRIQGTGTGVGIGTDLVSTDASIKQIYGYSFENVTCELFGTAIQLQGTWHSTLSNVITSSSSVGLHIWGQCVSMHIVGCKFRRDNISSTNSIGIRIQPRIYAWSPNQTRGSRSEAIIIDGETMCIGCEHGVYVDDCLDLHMSNLDLDYCLKSGVTIVNVDATHSFTNSWVAADAAGTSQFIAVNYGTPVDPSTKRIISGLHINAKNASTANTGIGINLADNNNFVSITDNTFNTGDFAIYSANSHDVVIENNLMGMQVYMTGCYDFRYNGNRLAGLQEASKPANTMNYYDSNTGTPATSGIVSVPLLAGATSGTLAIPNGQASLNYYLTKLDVNPSASADFLSISSTTITASRTSAVGVALSSLAKFTAR